MKNLSVLASFAGTCLLAGSAWAQASASLSLSTSEGASASGTGYMSKYRPKAGLVEVGLFGGVLLPSKDHNFQDESKPQQAFKSIAPDLGLRVGYYPLAFIGGEVEGAVMPTKTKDGEAAGLWALRAHVVGQLPYWSIVPFAVVGGGRMGAGSNAMGSDGDPLLHFGLGVKAPIDDFLMLRLDVRDNLTQKNDASNGTLTHHPEVLGGLTFVLDRKEKKPEPPKDGDKDGFVDEKDACPADPGVAPDGCPIKDSDGDGVMDPDDRCPAEAGPAPDGCPPRDSDGDGITDEMDKCPTEPGVAPEGCPDPDPDKDGISGDADKCPTEPETKNGFEDEDGCPDTIPEQVKQFTGVLQGIEFDTGLATIRPKSTKVLDDAAKVLLEYKKLRVRITGHTDGDGDRENNVKLSQARADSVKTYLVGKGVDASRIETRGAGPDEPVADNDTPAGKQKNRRIELQLIQ
ncbi:MAG: OmpA family protein [Myxococcales bacterium]|nr:OmpA family protein [Myxococcales bacterium]